jgi:hypothetical protein
MILLKQLVSLLVSLLMTPANMGQTAKRVMFSGSCSEVSGLLKHDMSAGT